MRNLRLILLPCLVLAACTTPPPPSEEQPIKDGAKIVESIRLCETTYPELAQRLGPPSRDGLLGRDRVVTWIVDWKPLIRYLGVLVDGRNVIVDRVWNLPSEAVWTPMNRCR